MDTRQSRPFTAAMDAGRVEAPDRHLGDDAVLPGPFVPGPTVERVSATRVLDVPVPGIDGHATDAVIEGEDRTAVMFRIRAGGSEVTGVDLVRADADGRVAGMTVPWRPPAGVAAIRQRPAPLIGVPTPGLVGTRS